MRVALVGPVFPYRGGIAHHTTRLAQALAAQHQVQTISFSRQYPQWLYPGRSDRDPSREPLRVPALYLLDPLYPWTWRQTARQIARFDPQVVVLQWWTTFWAPAFAALARWLRHQCCRVVFLIHNVMPHEPRAVDTWFAKLALRQGDHFIVQAEREQVRLVSIVPHARVTLCELPRFDLFSAQRVDKTDARAMLALPADVPLLLFFGIVRPYKGLRYLIDAVAQLRVRGRRVHLLVAGEIWEGRAAYTQQIEQLGLHESVQLMDAYLPNETVSLCFSAADVFVAPYVGGTQSGALRTALDFGLPIVTTTPHGAGLSAEPSMQVVPPHDAAALADAIARALSCTHAAPRAAGVSWASLVRAIEQAAASA